MPIGRRAKNLLDARRSTELDGRGSEGGEAAERGEAEGFETRLPAADRRPAHRCRTRLEEEQRDRVLTKRGAGPAVADASKLDSAADAGPRAARCDSRRRPDDRGDAADAPRGERRQRASQSKGKR